MLVAIKWLVRLCIVGSAVLCLAFLPLSFFVGGMAVGVSSSSVIPALFIIALPAIPCIVLLALLWWLEFHSRYFVYATPFALAALILLVAALFRIPAPLGFGGNQRPPPPSYATQVIEFSVGELRYRIPRNYLLAMSHWNGGPQDQVTMRVHLSDLAPATAAENACADRAQNAPGACDLLAFTVEPAPRRSVDQAFADVSRDFRNQTPLEGPFGYEKYQMGIENPQAEYYRKIVDGQTVVYACSVSNFQESPQGLCSPLEERTPGGAGIHFFFDFGKLGEIDQIDLGLRKLVDSFITN
jgi:hypothetical protein